MSTPQEKRNVIQSIKKQKLPQMFNTDETELFQAYEHFWHNMSVLAFNDEINEDERSPPSTR